MSERKGLEPTMLEHGTDHSKTIRSKSGFEVVWFNAVNTVTTKPGIYINFYRPDKKLKEKVFFEFGDRENAQKQFDAFVRKLKDWKEIE